MNKFIILDENESIKVFIDNVYEEIKRGKNAFISVYGYKYSIHSNISKNKLNFVIIDLLKDIKNYEQNKKLLINYSNLPEKTIKYIIDNSDPKEIANMCFELGLVDYSIKKTSL